MRLFFLPSQIALFALVSMFLPDSAAAQGLSVLTDLPGCDFQTGVLKASCIPVFIGHLIQMVFSLISVFFIINVMYAGYQIAMGSWSGDRTQGKDRLQWSIIGLIVAVCSFLILDLVLTVVLT